MRQVMYTQQFKGRADPAGTAPNVLKAVTTAPSCSIATVVGPGGVQGTLQSVAGGTASFESEVTVTGETSFQERGTIGFGPGHALRFSTLGEGYFGPCPDARLKHGSVTWRVDGGEGQFAGAQGLITSNFFLSDTGEVTDHQFGVIFVEIDR